MRAAEFFAGIGLVRAGLERAGIEVAWANDIEPHKAGVYGANFGLAEFRLGDIRAVRGVDVPAVDVATASFPCTNLSLAGRREGLAGAESGLFWEFTRVVEEMPQRPAALLIENVPAFASSKGGADLAAAVRRLNDLGYSCEVLQLDARRFVPQSRPRLFVVGSRRPLGPRPEQVDELHPKRLVDLAYAHPELDLHALPLDPPRPVACSLADVIEDLAADDPAWWSVEQTMRFTDSLSDVHLDRLLSLSGGERTWRTAYRRTRRGVAVWEVRSDETAGCLRTAKGGSSRQAVVEVGEMRLGVRWMTPTEYARLQGAPEGFALDLSRPNLMLSALGDAVCVPVIAWLAETHLRTAVLMDRIADAEHDAVIGWLAETQARMAAAG